jgi:hypothetical protein
MSIFFSLFFLVQIGGNDLIVNKVFRDLEQCKEMGITLSVIYYPESTTWECTPKQGNTA